MVYERAQLGARRRAMVAGQSARHLIAIEEALSRRGILPAAQVVLWRFLFVGMSKIARSALEFVPIDGQLRGWN
ncbi:hypothetical protein JQ582_34175 [Bradyrhizobium japonicum]|uniref:hypothetical protein n=1 Tax=Bradyrhizobium japonicum TaxID=375 RepID=UPI001BAD625F|nr:hypothetical protein [Bradyrhizobium japonicum]MBR0748992.1 hypothetical protein [Bradyrhizobium japonicum]